MKLINLIYLFGFIAIGNSEIIWSPYQVTIRLYDNFNSASSANSNINLCNGVIIHESYILTTAHCMHSYVLSANIRRPLLAGMIYVVGGNFSISDISRHVSSITIHEQYNWVTMENDIALLKLSEPLPLQNNTNVKWVEIEDTTMKTKYDNCFVNFYNVSSNNYPFTTPRLVVTMDNWFCNKSTNFTSLRRNDICSQYYFSDEFMCKLTSDKLILHYDRGTPILCNNHLTGILSQILPDNSTSCNQTLKTTAYYESVGKHFVWILKNIGISSSSTSHQIVTGAPAFYTPPVNQHPPSHGTNPGGKSIAASTMNLSLFLSTMIFIIMYLL